MQIQEKEPIKKIFEKSLYEFYGVENKPLTLSIPVLNDLPVKTISSSCSCSQVTPGKDYYIINVDPLPLVKYNVYNPEKEKTYIKTIWFKVNQEKINIKIKVTK